MKEIKLTLGFISLVDDDDFAELSQFNWHRDKDGYAFRNVKNSNITSIRMHRQIMQLTKNDGNFIDHIDGNRLNNQRSNIRLCTKQQNMMNMKRHRDCKSGFKGVSKAKNKNTWIAEIMTNGIRIRKGGFLTPESAYSFYCANALKNNGDFARLE